MVDNEYVSVKNEAWEGDFLNAVQSFKSQNIKVGLYPRCSTGVLFTAGWLLID